jgi:hypothetical protein
MMRRTIVLKIVTDASDILPAGDLVAVIERHLDRQACRHWGATIMSDTEHVVIER